MERTPEYQVLPEEGTSFLYPQLVTWNEHLLLLYLVRKSGETECQLQGVFPFEEQKFLLPEVFSEDALYSYHVLEGKLLLSVVSSGKTWVYLITERGECKELVEREWKEEELLANGQEQIQKLEEKLREKEAVIENVKVQYEDLMNTATQYREEAKKWRGKYLTKK